MKMKTMNYGSNPPQVHLSNFPMNTHHTQNSLAYQRAKKKLAEKIQAYRDGDHIELDYLKGLVDAFSILCRSKYQ